jgi:hypothetical protein
VNNSGTAFHLSADDLVYLKGQGVDAPGQSRGSGSPARAATCRESSAGSGSPICAGSRPPIRAGRGPPATWPPSPNGPARAARRRG